MPLNPYFTQGTGRATDSEQNLIEDLIIESLKIYGQEMIYIPRTLVSKDEILGEDRLSEFKDSYSIEMYFENINSLDGQNFFMQKFGLMVEQSATLVVARRRWEKLIGKKGKSILPNRPAEGDLIYFPLTKGLFEIKFVKHQDPFYQLGKLYVYKLQVELFQYSSEKIDTGNPDIDVFESLKTFSTDLEKIPHGFIKTITITSGGFGYTNATVTVNSETGSGAILTPVIQDGVITAINIISGGTGYSPTDTISIEGDGIYATATITIAVDIDAAGNYGKNNEFKKESVGIVFDTNNPFGDV